ncbi:MAG: transglycosylase domain-containing protein, partial [Candidatus Eisenbacteria bacterium]
MFVVLLLLLGVCAVPFARFAVQVRAFAARRATGPAWSFPSRLWSDALVLERGRPLPEGYLREHLEMRGYHQVRTPRMPGEWAPASAGVVLVLRGFPVPFDSPSPGQVAVPRGPERVRLRIASGRISDVQRLGRVRGFPSPDLLHAPSLEPMLIATVADSDRVYRQWVPLTRMPRALRLAVIASEDRRFRRHMGLDLKGNFRALATNMRAGSVRQGASTITQQLARGLFLGPERTMGRKLQEMAIAVGLEILLSKEQILEMYLNSVYLGRMGPMGGAGARGIAGVGEASWRIYGVPVESLTLGQCAALVGSIPAPNLYSPLRRPGQALRRRRSVLRDMLETGVLDSTLARKAAAEPLRAHATPAPEDRFASSVSAAKQELASELSKDALEHWGLDVFTSIDPVWQARAERELTRGVQSQEDWRGRASDILQGAFVLLDAPSGEVRAIVGGRSDHPSQFNRVTQAHRQPGSAIKAVVYAAALDPSRGNPRFTPGSTVSDMRQEFDTPEGPWKPRNDEGDYHPTVTLAKALVKSLNLATADLVHRIGPSTVARYVERFGLGRPAAVASIGLGTHEVTPLALAGAYTVFSNTGWRREPRLVRAVRDGLGQSVTLPARPRIPVLPEPTAALSRGMLEDVVIFGIAYPLRAQYGFTRPCG